MLWAVEFYSHLVKLPILSRDICTWTYDCNSCLMPCMVLEVIHWNSILTKCIFLHHRKAGPFCAEYSCSDCIRLNEIHQLNSRIDLHSLNNPKIHNDSPQAISLDFGASKGHLLSLNLRVIASLHIDHSHSPFGLFSLSYHCIQQSANCGFSQYLQLS